jgi:hypothetical protein
VWRSIRVDGCRCPIIRHRVAFVSAYAPYSSIATFVQDIASATKSEGKTRVPWHVDPLTRKVYVHSMTAVLDASEAERLRNALAEPDGQIESGELSEDGRAIYPLLTTLDRDDAKAALEQLSIAMQQRLAAISPMNYVQDIHAPLVVFFHDRDDVVIPVRIRQLRAALIPGVRYTEFTVFQHLTPPKGNRCFLCSRARENVSRAYPFLQAVGRREPLSGCGNPSTAEQ